VSERAKYDEAYGPGRSALAEVMRSVWGDARPTELGWMNFVTWSELERLAADLPVTAGGRLIDLGSGTGGPGLWMAQRLATTLVGIDMSPPGCAAARRRHERSFTDIAASFVASDMTRAPFVDGAADAIMSIDAVQIPPDRLAIYREAARLLSPGRRFAFTTYDHPDPPPPDGRRPGRQLVPDSRPLLGAAGFDVLRYDTIPTWPDKAIEHYRGILERRDDVAAAMGPAFVKEAEWGVKYAKFSRHVLIVAERAPTHSPG